MTAGDFLAARSEHGAIEFLPSSNGFDLDAAYRMEWEIMRMREAAGYRAVGRKVGFASKAMWRILKLDTLVWAHMFDDTVQYAPGGAGELAVSHLRSPKLEPEIVVKLRDGVSGPALNAIEWIALGFEILDCPYPDWKFQPADFVAAWGLHAALYIGPPLPVSESNAATLANQLADFKLWLKRNGEFVEEGAGKNSLRSPALCVEELARASAARNHPLRPGELISTGTLTNAHPVARGEEWLAELNGLPLPPLRVQFT